METRWGPAVMASAGAVGAGYVLSLDPRYIVVPALAALGVLAIGLGYHRPDLLLTAAFATLAFIPSSAFGELGSLLLDPATLLLWALAAGLVVRALATHSAPRMTLIDGAALLFFLCLLVPVLFSVRSIHIYAGVLFAWLGPYLALRLAVGRLRSPAGVPRRFVLAAVALVPLALFEAATHRHLYGGVVPIPVERLDTPRVVVGFAHPIGLAMFLAAAAVLALGMGVLGHHGRARVLWIGAAVVLALTQALALSRIGWVVLAVGAVLLVAARPVVLARPTVVAAAVAVALVVTLSNAVGPTRDLLSGRGSGSAAAVSARSIGYRQELLARALEPGALRVTGNKERVRGPRGATSIDNEYILLADQWGWIGLGGFAALVTALLLGAVRTRRDATSACVFAATIASLVGLGGVAFFGQHQVYIWMLTGACSALVGTRARGGGPRVAPRPGTATLTGGL